MNCELLREKIHDYMDFRLSFREIAEIETHLADCSSCRLIHEELSSIQELLSIKIKFPEPTSSHCLKCIRRKRFWNEPAATMRRLGRNARSYVRDLNPASVLSRLAAIPLTLCFFILLIGQFPLLSLHSVKFPVLSMQGWTDSAEIQSLSTRTYATRQGQTRFKGLMDTAFRLPYEDSLSLVAEITPGGHARIGGVLEYPKSNELFNAADLALRSSQFVANDTNSRPYVIFSFHKIDVWESHLHPNIQ